MFSLPVIFSGSILCPLQDWLRSQWEYHFMGYSHHIQRCTVENVSEIKDQFQIRSRVFSCFNRSRISQIDPSNSRSTRSTTKSGERWLDVPPLSLPISRHLNKCQISLSPSISPPFWKLEVNISSDKWSLNHDINDLNLLSSEPY